jgi:hypothetical protein
MLVRRFPAVVSPEVKGTGAQTAALTDQGVRAMSSLPALTFLDLTACGEVTDEGLRAVSSVSTLRISKSRTAAR